MGYSLKKRRSRRISVDLEAELISYNTRYSAFIENISEHSICAKIAHHKTTEEFKRKPRVYLKLRLPSGHVIHLNGKTIWSDKNTPHSLIGHIAVEIVNPPQEYTLFYRAMSHNQN